MPHADDWNWKSSLREDLEKFAGHYTTGRHPSSVETQREYEQGLFHLEQRYSNELDRYFAGERREFDESYKRQRLGELDAAERQASGRSRRPEDQIAVRTGQKGDRDALERGDFRETEDYKRRMQSLVERQADDRDRADRAFRQVEQELNERFGFERERGDRGMER